jgi:uncharacterized protein with von Willebrand factor type A (vWA) domain
MKNATFSQLTPLSSEIYVSSIPFRDISADFSLGLEDIKKCWKLYNKTVRQGKLKKLP